MLARALGLGREEEGGPEPDPLRPEPQHLRDSRAVHDPAGRDDGHRHDLAAGGHELRERHEREAAEERSPMAARLGSLGDHGVDTRLLECPSLLRRRRRPERDDACVPQRGRIDRPEGEAEHRRTLVEHHLERAAALVGGAKRLTEKGPSVELRTSRIAARNSSRLNQCASAISSSSTLIRWLPGAWARNPSIRLRGIGHGWLPT